MIQIAFAFLFLSFIQADLPVTCLRSDILGKWNFVISHTLHSEFERNSCGYRSPSTEETSYQTANLQFNNPFSLSLHLCSNSSVLSGELKPIGYWTMVYYQSMEININYSFYVNFKYIPKINEPKNYLSICYETLAGWWEDRRSGEKGCFKAYKEENDTIRGNYRRHTFLNRFFFKKSDDFIENNRNVNDLIEEINDKNMIWKAGIDKSFENLSLNQLREKLHGKKRIFGMKNVNKKKNHFFDLKKQSTTTQYNADDEIIKSLPKNFDLSNLISNVHRQKCGNCYLQSTVSMYEARIKYKLGEDLELSRSFYHHCDYYNQGCGGGYTHPLNRFTREFGLIEKNCFSYNSFFKQNCSEVNQCSKNYTISDY